jgi:hypothetical protein
MSLKLFALYLGGKHPDANIEVHDVVFTIAESLEKTYPKLIASWFGNTKKLHIDSYLELSSVEGYDIELISAEEYSKITDINNLKLYFINIGASQKNKFEEIHESGFYVTQSRAEAVNKAKRELCKNSINIHLDDFVDIDDCLEISEVEHYKIKLVSNVQAKMPQVVTKYIKVTQ